MEVQPTASHHDHRTAAELLRHALAEMEARYEAEGRATIGDLLRPLGARSGPLGAVLLALPFLSPFSLGPITTPASLAIGLLGFRLLQERDELPLPGRVLNVPVPRPVHRLMQRMLARVSAWGRRKRERPARPALDARGKRLCGAGVLAGAVLLAVPVPLLPLTNTLPAAAIICFALGWSNQDRRLTTYGFGALAGSVAIFAALGLAVYTLGWEAVRQLAPL